MRNTDLLPALGKQVQVFEQWAAQNVVVADDTTGCSCRGHRLVVIHDRGSYCGDDQHDRLWHAVDGSGAIDATDAVNAVLDALRGDHRA